MDSYDKSNLSFSCKHHKEGAMSKEKSPILFLDSGIGGLSVMKAAAKLMPHQNFLYAADYAGAPYGIKSEAEIASRVPALLGRLLERYKPSLITIACNTACTIALSHVRAALNVPIVGTVPAIKPASLATKSGVIGLLGTDATIRQPYIDRLKDKYAPDYTMLKHGAPELVYAAEAKMRGEKVNLDLIANALSGLTKQEKGDRLDHIILGCTHFPLLLDELSELMPEMKFLDGADGIAQQIHRLMIANNAPPTTEGIPQHHFITSGDLTDIKSYKTVLNGHGFNQYSQI